MINKFSENDELLKESLEGYFEQSKVMVDALFVPDEAEIFWNRLHLDLRESDSGNSIPTCTYRRNRESEYTVIAEIGSLLGKAYELSEYYITQEGEEKHGISEEDTLRLLIGAGVGRVILGVKLLPVMLNPSNRVRSDLRDKLSDKASLNKFAKYHDKKFNQEILEDINFGEVEVSSSASPLLGVSIDNMGDDEISKVNTYRFGFGVALQYMMNSMVAIEVANRAREALFDDQKERARDLKEYMIVTGDMDTSFKLYDDTVNHFLLALSCPMQPGEELMVLARPRDEDF